MCVLQDAPPPLIPGSRVVAGPSFDSGQHQSAVLGADSSQSRARGRALPCQRSCPGQWASAGRRRCLESESAQLMRRPRPDAERTRRGERRREERRPAGTTPRPHCHELCSMHLLLATRLLLLLLLLRLLRLLLLRPRPRPREPRSRRLPAHRRGGGGGEISPRLGRWPPTCRHNC